MIKWWRSSSDPEHYCYPRQCVKFRALLKNILGSDIWYRGKDTIWNACIPFWSPGTQVPASLLPWEAAGGGSCFWVPATHTGEPHWVSDSWLWLGLCRHLRSQPVDGSFLCVSYSQCLSNKYYLKNANCFILIGGISKGLYKMKLNEKIHLFWLSLHMKGFQKLMENIYYEEFCIAFALFLHKLVFAFHFSMKFLEVPSH